MESVFWTYTRVCYARHLNWLGIGNARAVDILNQEWMLTAPTIEQKRWPAGPFTVLSLRVVLIAIRASRHRLFLVPVMVYYWLARKKRCPTPGALNFVWKARNPNQVCQEPFTLLTKKQALRLLNSAYEDFLAADALCYMGH